MRHQNGLESSLATQRNPLNKHEMQVLHSDFYPLDIRCIISISFQSPIHVVQQVI